MERESKKVAYAAIAANCLIAATKFGAAAWTGSSAMMSEGIHSLVDTSNQLLLLYGMRRASEMADEQHPWGRGRELYFWSFIVALLIFALGAGLSTYEGVVRLLHPTRIDQPLVNYAVLSALQSLRLGPGTWHSAPSTARVGRLDSFAPSDAARTRPYSLCCSRIRLH